MMLSVKRLTLEQWMDCLRNGTTLGDGSTNNVVATRADGSAAVTAKRTQRQPCSERSGTRNNQMKRNGTARLDTQSDSVELWRQAVLGDAMARDALLRRIMPASALDASPAIIAFDLSTVRWQPAGALA